MRGFKGKRTVIVALTVSVLLAVGVGFPWAREKARQRDECGRLRSLGLSLLQYSCDGNDDFFPPDFKILCERDYISTGFFFISPGSSTPSPKSPAELLDGKHCDYYYWGCGKKYVGGKPEILVSVKPGMRWGSFVHVLYTNGEVKGFKTPPPELQRLTSGLPVSSTPN